MQRLRGGGGENVRISAAVLLVFNKKLVQTNLECGRGYKNVC